MESAVQITCRCGQPFTVFNERFPHRVRCHICGRHFHVLIDGAILDDDYLHAEPTSEKAESTAINSDAPLPSAGPMNDMPLPTPDATHTAQTELDAEIRAIDLSWSNYRDTHVLVQFAGFNVLPSKMLSVAVALTLAAAWGVLLGFAFSMNIESWRLPGAAGLAISAIIPIYLFATAHRFEKAEADWRRRRDIAVTNAGLPANAAETIETGRPLWLKVFLGFGIFAFLVVAVDMLVPRNLGISWVGQRDLEITFVVLDAETNQPIAGAEIDVPKSRTPFCDGCDDAFKLATDGDGRAAKICKNCMCYGYSGTTAFFRPVERFGTHTPEWVINVTAPGYHENGPISVQEPEFRRTIQRGEKFTTMMVTTKLHRQNPAN